MFECGNKMEGWDWGRNQEGGWDQLSPVPLDPMLHIWLKNLAQKSPKITGADWRRLIEGTVLLCRGKGP